MKPDLKTQSRIVRSYKFLVDFYNEMQMAESLAFEDCDKMEKEQERILRKYTKALECLLEDCN